MGMFLLCTFLMIILYPLGIDLYLVAVPRIAPVSYTHLTLPTKA